MKRVLCLVGLVLLGIAVEPLVGQGEFRVGIRVKITFAQEKVQSRPDLQMLHVHFLFLFAFCALITKVSTTGLHFADLFL